MRPRRCGTNAAKRTELAPARSIVLTAASRGWQILTRSLSGWLAHEGARLSASLSLYSLLSLAPLVIICIAIASLGFGRSAAQNAVVNEVRSLMGEDGARTVETVIEYGKLPRTGGIASVLGILTLLFAASSVFGELRSALNKIWGAKPQPGSGLLGMFKERLFSFAMLLALGFLMLVSLLFSAGLAALGGYASAHLWMPKAVLAVVSEAGSFLAISALVAVILRYVPELRPRWRDVAPGAIGTALLFTAGKALLGVYLGKVAVGSAYGAAGSFVVVIVWVYYSAMIFYFGAEFTRVLIQEARGTGSLPENLAHATRNRPADATHETAVRERSSRHFAVIPGSRWCSRPLTPRHRRGGAHRTQ